MTKAQQIEPITECSWTVVKEMHQGGRSRQEDAMGYWRSRTGSDWLAVVADGAGGHGGGAEASCAAVATAERCWAQRQESCDGAGFLASWMSEAHDAVNREARNGSSDGRTVVVALLVQGDQAEWVHAGDCRLYHFREGSLLGRTRDDSVVQILFEQGEIAEEEMGHHPDQNRLLQALGGEERPTPRRGFAKVEPGDVFLLCSDGFWENLESAEITELVNSQSRFWRRSLRRLVKVAVSRGGGTADNTSVVMAGFRKGGGVLSLLLMRRMILVFATILLSLLTLLVVLAPKVKERLGKTADWIVFKISQPVDIGKAPGGPFSSEGIERSSPVSGSKPLPEAPRMTDGLPAQADLVQPESSSGVVPVGSALKGTEARRPAAPLSPEFPDPEPVGRKKSVRPSEELP